MGRTQAIFCNEETCNRLGVDYLDGQWFKFSTLDLDFCSVECALEYLREYPEEDASDRVVILTAIKARCAINPDTRRDFIAWQERYGTDE